MKRNSVLIGFLALVACMPFLACEGNKKVDNQKQLRLSQYMVEGKRLYLQHCANCHQTEGQGLARLYPPLAHSDFLADTSRVICSIKNGLSGEIVVNGVFFNMEMPSNPKLTDLEIAELSTFIYNQWHDGEKRIITTDKVSVILEGCR